MTGLFRHVCLAVGALSLLGAVAPGARESVGRFSTARGRPLGRAARAMLLVVGLAWIAVGLTCAP
ncbi:hypothetical protein [Roseisolibacter sp. H3M3-2]|uniref:hypothetical protein n=1 Tax=Roseisolibacter sp. H3M3-2 TaxID=3031323 RepID=UPI0023DCA9FE|nr:hypothetical protein [Roseisolibacter sp. H3M3-2]MDF1504357.1 hypothetical protein [Roseisolibacter sp. H3M3-2]